MLDRDRRLHGAKEIMEQSVGIKLGIPALSAAQAKTYEGIGWEQIAIPNIPHVFFVKRLDLRKKGERISFFDNVTVILGHGIVSQRDGQESWRFFGTNKSTYETVEAYERFAKDLNLPPLDFVLSCRGNNFPRSRPKENVVYVSPRRPLRIQPATEVPHIYPTSGVIVTSYWKKSPEGVENITPDAIDWQGVTHWENWWRRNTLRREHISVPNLFKQQVR